jgi:endonuclease/exonuclease/phosphatase family metal-dependent hydrolase
MKVTVLIILFLFTLIRPAGGQDFSVMFYNVENLFDTVNDSTTNDDEFLPEGDRHWTTGRYRKKLSALAQAIAAAGQWELPGLAGLCEVENEGVVRDLAYGTILSAGNYGIVHRESPDRRGIDLALLYDRERFRITAVRSWIPGRPEDDPFESRNLLYVKTVTSGDTLHVILCHFPSRRGGVLAAEGAREEMAMLVRAKTDSILAVSGRASIIVMGDFNSGASEEVMKIMADNTRLINAAGQSPPGSGGSYRYQGTWELIDQILISSSMAEGSGSFHADIQSFRVADAPFLLAEDPLYPGKKPFPAYYGYKWVGGYSDHLPVLLNVGHTTHSSGL